MDGKIGDSLSGSAIEPPDLTDSITSAIAFSTTELPAVWPVISIACMIGTPAAYRAEKVRDQRASEIFWTVTPMLKGNFRRTASHCGRPHEDLRHFLNAIGSTMAAPISRYHWWVTRFEAATVILVIIGSSPPKSLKTFTNWGTMKAIIPISTSIANERTTIG